MSLDRQVRGAMRYILETGDLSSVSPDQARALANLLASRGVYPDRWRTVITMDASNEKDLERPIPLGFRSEYGEGVGVYAENPGSVFGLSGFPIEIKVWEGRLQVWIWLGSQWSRATLPLDNDSGYGDEPVAINIPPGNLNDGL